MRSAKILIAFTLLLTFASQISAQENQPEIVWRNLQKRYSNFYQIRPRIINNSNAPVYILDITDSIDFEWFDKKSNSWIVSREWRCGTGYKPHITKIKPTEEIPFLYYNEKWDEITTMESSGELKFRKFPEYQGEGKYRFKIRFGIKKSNLKYFLVYSPEFKVIEEIPNK